MTEEAFMQPGESGRIADTFIWLVGSYCFWCELFPLALLCISGIVHCRTRAKSRRPSTLLRGSRKLVHATTISEAIVQKLHAFTLRGTAKAFRRLGRTVALPGLLLIVFMGMCAFVFEAVETPAEERRHDELVALMVDLSTALRNDTELLDRVMEVTPTAVDDSGVKWRDWDYFGSLFHVSPLPRCTQLIMT